MLPGFDPAGMGNDSAYPAVGVLFDGANDYYTRGANFTGLTDGRRWTVSFWFRRNGGTGTLQRVMGDDGAGNKFNLRFNAGNTIQMIGTDSGGTTRVDVTSTAAYSDTTTWHHFLFSVSTLGHVAYMYVDDVDVSSVATLSSTNNVELSRTNHSLGADTDGTDKLNADLADVLFHNSFLDISSEANRRKFITSSHRPVDLGSDGSIPFGTAPILFQRVRPGGVAGDFTTNRGTGGGMTMTGTTTLSATNP